MIEDDPVADSGETHEPAEITYDEQFYPARPRRLRPRARLRGLFSRRPPRPGSGKPVGTNPEYVEWLIGESMLSDAVEISRQFSGQPSMFQNPYANPDPRAAIEQASVWFTAYPISMITKPGTSFLGMLGDPDLWEAFHAIGIDAIHTGPVKEAGGLDGWDKTPSVDGHFDRISTKIDEAFGTEDEFRTLCEVAARYGGTVIDDIVPGHTGKGADFRLAEMKVGDYPGIYHMVEIPREDWHLLPPVPRGKDSVNLDVEAEAQLQKSGYIIGQLQRVIFAEPGVKDTNWSATAPVIGPDGVERRWVYLHYFKEGQPTFDWLDPTFAGMRLVIGDALHSISDLGSGALRLDANGFLGVEKSVEGAPAWSEGHPLSEAANQLIASMVRKVGAFTFQELNLSIDDIRTSSERGADLSYDFVNRPAYHHALATADTEFLRLTLNLALELGVEAVSLVHALQNHDELTYELVHFATEHAADVFEFRGGEHTGEEMATIIRTDLLDRLTGERAPYNLTFTTNGIASTTATVIAASLGLTAIDPADPEQVDRIRRAHLLLAMFNAWQPGVFALSGWDLTGMLTLERSKIAALLSTGDTRWIHRAAYDLMDFQPDATHSASQMPRGVSLYGSLPQQLRDPDSFVSRLTEILRIRSTYKIATSTQVDVPPSSNKAMLVMVQRLETDDLAGAARPGDDHAAGHRSADDHGRGDDRSADDHGGGDQGGGDPGGGDRVPAEAVHQVTVLNFSDATIFGHVRSEHLQPSAVVVDMVTDELVAEVDDLFTFSVALAAHSGKSFLVRPRAEGDAEVGVPEFSEE